MKRQDYISWDEYFMMITEDVATRSTCIRRQVGAIIVKDGKIIIQMKKKATTPIFKSCDVFRNSYEVPWFGGKKLHYEWIS